jgi:hypothetical protein
MMPDRIPVKNVAIGVINLKNSADTQKYFQKFNSVFQCSDSISIANLRNESKEILVED